VLFGLLADTLRLRGSLVVLACVGAVLSFSGIAVPAALGVAPAFVVLLVCNSAFSLFRVSMIGLTDVTALESGVDYGRIRLFGSLGFLVVAVSSGHLLDPEALALTLPRTVKRPPQPVLADLRVLLGSRDFALFLGAVALWAASQNAYDFYFSLHLTDLGADAGVISWAWGLATAAEVLLLIGASRWVVRFGTVPLLLVAYGATVVRWVLLATVPSLGVLLALQPLHAVTFGLAWVATLEHVKRRAPAHVLATAQASLLAATGVGGAVSMLAWGAISEVGKGPGVFLTAAGVAALAAGMLAGVGWRRPPGASEALDPAARSGAPVTPGEP
jgi:PPP family 3-phenylpropionic acid transporter